MGAYLYIVILFPSLRRLREVGLKFQDSLKPSQDMMRLSQKHRGWGYSSSVEGLLTVCKAIGSVSSTGEKKDTLTS